MNKGIYFLIIKPGSIKLIEVTQQLGGKILPRQAEVAKSFFEERKNAP